MFLLLKKRIKIMNMFYVGLELLNGSVNYFYYTDSFKCYR